jgi:hypothetical protein
MATSKQQKLLEGGAPRDMEDDDESSYREQGGEESSATGNDSAISERREDVIAKAETKAVLRIKLVVLMVLVSSTIGVASSVYAYIARSEERLFRTQFEDNAKKILQAVGSSLDKTLGSFDSVAVTLVSHASATGQRWPFVTLPNFAVRMSKVLPLTDAININLVPIVTQAQRAEWEAYSVQNDGWVNEGMAVQEKWDGYHGPVVYNGTKYGTIHGDFGDIEQNLR